MTRKERAWVVLLLSPLKYAVGHGAEPGRHCKDPVLLLKCELQTICVRITWRGSDLICRDLSLTPDLPDQNQNLYEWDSVASTSPQVTIMCTKAVESYFWAWLWRLKDWTQCACHQLAVWPWNCLHSLRDSFLICKLCQEIVPASCVVSQNKIHTPESGTLSVHY